MLGLFGTPLDSGYNVSHLKITNLFLHVRANGDFVITWNETASGPTNTTYAMVYSGSWSSRITVQASLSVPVQICSTSISNETAILVATVDSGEDLLSLHLVILTGTSVTSTTVALADASKILGETWYPLEPSLYDSDSDSMIFPIVQQPAGPATPVQIDLLIGATSATPSFSIKNVVTAVDNSQGYDMPQIVKTDTGFTVLAINHAIDPYDQIIQFNSSTLTGTWSSQAVFWDEGTDPVGPPVVPALGLFSLSVSFISSQLAVSVGPYATVDAENWCGVQYFFPLSSSPPTLTCPVGGGTATFGVPYSKSLIATGVTGSATYAITAGALPLGLMLNTSSGLISGTPLVTGNFSITYTVTDSGTGLTSTPVICPISIPGSRPARLCPTL